MPRIRLFLAPASNSGRLQVWKLPLSGARCTDPGVQAATRPPPLLSNSMENPQRSTPSVTVRTHCCASFGSNIIGSMHGTALNHSLSIESLQNRQQYRGLSWFSGAAAPCNPSSEGGSAAIAHPAHDGKSGEVVDGGLVDLVQETVVEEAQIQSLWQLMKSGSPEFWVNVSYAQQVFIDVHETTGLPWWSVIVCTTVGTRAILFPLFLYQQKVGGRLQKAIPLLQEVEREYIMARDVFKDPGALRRRTEKSRAIYKEHKCHPWRLGVNMLFLGPIFGSYFFGIKGMAGRLPDLATGGALWFSNLAVPDPMYALPAITAGSFLLVLEVAVKGRQHAMPPMQYKMQVGVQRIACVSMFPLLVGLKYPAGVFLYWITNNLISGIQAFGFNQPSVRTFFGLTPLPKVSPFNLQQLEQQQAAFSGVGAGIAGQAASPHRPPFAQEPSSKPRTLESETKVGPQSEKKIS